MRPLAPLLVQFVPATPATDSSFKSAYEGDVGYLKDSFIFLHKEGHYHISSPTTPLALFWRDRHISRFVVDTPDAQGQDLTAVSLLSIWP